MLETISRKITEHLIRRKIIQPQEYDLYVYSVNSLLGNLLNIVTPLVLGACLKRELLAVVLLIVLIPLRSMIGGFHLQSAWLCFIISNLIAAGCMLLPDLVILPWKVSLAVVIAVGILIGITAPVDCINKPMTMEEKQKMKPRIWIWLVAVMVITGVSAWCGQVKVYNEVVWIVFYAYATLLMELVNKRIKRESRK